MVASWFQRRRARRRLRESVGLWYHPQYKAEALAETARVLGVEVARGERILGALAATLRFDGGLVRPAPLALVVDLRKVHPQSYLEKTAHPESLGGVFGLEARYIDVDPLLIAQRRQVGGTVDAARWAVAEDGRTAFNIGGGFHHAEPEAGMGFCVYNDIAIAIAVLRESGYQLPIAIVDLDYHQGNGNIVTFEEDETVFTYSLHGSTWSHVQAARDQQFLLPSGTKDEAYLARLRQTLPAAIEEHSTGLVFYIAGNDVLAGDQLGEFELTREGVLERDRFVTQVARQNRCPLVVTLGGGYSEDAWRPSADFINWLLTDEAELSGPPETDLYQQYAEIARALNPYELQRDSGTWKLSEEDLMGDLTGPRHRSMRILDYYSSHGVHFALEQYGLMDELRSSGFRAPRLTIDPTDPDKQRITVHGTKDGAEHLLIELVMRLTTSPALKGMEPAVEIRLLSVEWLLLQNPTEDFSLRHPQLPGQEHPGLGVGEQLMHMLLQAVHRLGLDGIAHHPSRYHIAFFGGGQFFFLDPGVQGRFEALREVLGPLDLVEAAWLMERGEVRRADGTPIEWEAEVCVVPASERLLRYLGSANYQDPRREARARAEERGVVIGAPERSLSP